MQRTCDTIGRTINAVISGIHQSRCLFLSIQTGVPVPPGQAFLKYPDTVPAVSGRRSCFIRPKAGTSCMECSIDFSVLLSPSSWFVMCGLKLGPFSSTLWALLTSRSKTVSLRPGEGTLGKTLEHKGNICRVREGPTIMIVHGFRRKRDILCRSQNRLPGSVPASNRGPWGSSVKTTQPSSSMPWRQLGRSDR